MVPPSSQDEALASYSVSVEALRSILKFKLTSAPRPLTVLTTPVFETYGETRGSMTPEKLGGSSPTDGSWPELAVLALVTRGHSGPGTLRLAGVAPWGPWPAQTPISPVPRAASATIRTPCDMPGGDPHCPRTARALKCGFRTSPLPQAPSKRLSPHEGGGLAHTPLSPHPALTSSHLKATRMRVQTESRER